jgi:hypothetical protein
MEIVKEIKVYELMEKKNSIEAEIASIEIGLVDKNTRTLIEEVMNFLDKVGNFIPGDYWAGARVYSKIKGVKNLNVNGDIIYVKILSPLGKLIPNKIEIRGIKYTTKLYFSSKYCNKIDY